MATLLNKGTTQPSSIQMQAFEALYPRSKYQTNLNPPAEFPAILKNFAREVLREQPDNIYQFGIDYFTALKTGQKPKMNTVIEKKINHDHGQKHATQPRATSSTTPDEEAPNVMESHFVKVDEKEENEPQEEFVEQNTQSNDQNDSRPQSAYDEEIPEDAQEGEEEQSEEGEEIEGESVYEEDSRPQSALQDE